MIFLTTYLLNKWEKAKIKLESDIIVCNKPLSPVGLLLNS